MEDDIVSPSDEAVKRREEFEKNGGKMLDAYCTKCKLKQLIKDPERVTLKNGKKAIKGSCMSCGAKVYRMGDYAVPSSETVKALAKGVSKEAKPFKSRVVRAQPSASKSQPRIVGQPVIQPPQESAADEIQEYLEVAKKHLEDGARYFEVREDTLYARMGPEYSSGVRKVGPYSKELEAALTELVEEKNAALQKVEEEKEAKAAAGIVDSKEIGMAKTSEHRPFLEQSTAFATNEALVLYQVGKVAKEVVSLSKGLSGPEALDAAQKWDSPKAQAEYIIMGLRQLLTLANSAKDPHVVVRLRISNMKLEEKLGGLMKEYQSEMEYNDKIKYELDVATATMCSDCQKAYLRKMIFSRIVKPPGRNGNGEEGGAKTKEQLLPNEPEET